MTIFHSPFLIIMEILTTTILPATSERTSLFIQVKATQKPVFCSSSRILFIYSLANLGQKLVQEIPFVSLFCSTAAFPYRNVE